MVCGYFVYFLCFGFCSKKKFEWDQTVVNAKNATNSRWNDISKRSMYVWSPMKTIATLSLWHPELLLYVWCIRIACNYCTAIQSATQTFIYTSVERSSWYANSWFICQNAQRLIASFYNVQLQIQTQQIHKRMSLYIN